MQRFSCIIGPNGSGKSDVIDSMLFVFGYRAQKIRSKKLSVLIHNSDEHKDIQSCTVEVHFQKIIDKVRGFLVFCSFKEHKGFQYIAHFIIFVLNWLVKVNIWLKKANIGRVISLALFSF